MNSRKVLFLGLLVGVLAATRADIAGQDRQVDVVDLDSAENSGLWFVEMASPPTADGSSATQVRAEKAAFRRNAAQAGITFQERHAFDWLWNGVSIRVSAEEVGKLARLAGVKAIYPVATVSIPDVEPVASPELVTALAQTGVDVAQQELGLTGEGIKVAVMDTGIDYHHPDLGGGFGPGHRVVTGWDFVGDAFNSGGAGAALTPKPDADPDDCNGHGTHVAGIVGANGEVKGVAPGVTFGAYRVFGCDGSTNADIMIAAMERALADGMDVLNMSIGSSFQWPQYPTAQASNRAVNKGMVVIASAGNSGANGLYSLSAPSVGEKVISVASYENTHANLAAFTLSSDGRAVGYGNATAAPPAPLTGTFPMARTGTTTTANDACAALPAGSLAGKVALIRRGTCGFHDKARNAQAAGAVGVVLYNNQAGRVSPTVAGPVPITIPVVAITAADGAVIDGRIAAEGVDLTWTDQSISERLASAGLISGFSSYGLSPDLTLKPDIGAPGGQIRSTYPMELGAYATIGGTSMSSPHVAGAVALLLQARPKTNAQAVRAILQNSAEPAMWWGNPGLGFLDNVHRQGAGMLDIDDAILSTTRIEPSKMSLGESQAGAVTRTLTIDNDGPADVTYSLSHVPALSTGAATYVPAATTGFASVVFSASSVTVPFGGTATVDVTVTANPALGDGSMYGGYVVFTPQGGGATYRVPYSGFKGDYQAISVLNPAATAFGFPWLAKRTATGFSNQPAGATYTMQGTDIPNVLVHLDHQSRRVRLEVTDVATGASWHRALDLDYVGRNAGRDAGPAGTTNFFFALPWDGSTQAGKKVYTVPNGQYRITLSVIRALGDESNPAHVETWTSPVITVARPAPPTP